MSQDVLRSSYFSFVHSILSYGIIFWGNLFHSEEIFKIRKEYLEYLRIQVRMLLVSDYLRN